MEVQRQEQKAVSPQGSLYWVSDVLVCRGGGRIWVCALDR